MSFRSSDKLTSVGSTEQILGRPCTLWRLLSADPNSTSTICWDDALKLPLMIRGADDRIVWRITAVDATPIAEGVFAADRPGVAQINMNADFDADAD